MNNTLLGKNELSLYDYVKLKNIILNIFMLFKHLKLSNDEILLPKITDDYQVCYDNFIKVDNSQIREFDLKSLLLKVKKDNEKYQLLSKITLAMRKLNNLELQVFDLTFYRCFSENDIINTVHYSKDKIREIKKSACIKFVTALGLDDFCFKS